MDSQTDRDDSNKRRDGRMKDLFWSPRPPDRNSVPKTLLSTDKNQRGKHRGNNNHFTANRSKPTSSTRRKGANTLGYDRPVIPPVHPLPKKGYSSIRPAEKRWTVNPALIKEPNTTSRGRGAHPHNTNRAAHDSTGGDGTRNSAGKRAPHQSGNRVPHGYGEQGRQKAKNERRQDSHQDRQTRHQASNGNHQLPVRNNKLQPGNTNNQPPPQHRSLHSPHSAPSELKPTPLAEKHVAVVDGSNVAYAERTKDGKPQVRNITTLLQALQKERVQPIIIVDAALKHQVDDPQQLESLIANQSVRQAPAETDADYFILKTAEEQNARVISNDLYEPYRSQFPWVEKRRTPFMIVGGQVELYQK